jgi:hypothetical protein
MATAVRDLAWHAGRGAGVDVEGLAKEVHRHGRALEVPSRTPFAEHLVSNTAGDDERTRGVELFERTFEVADHERAAVYAIIRAHRRCSSRERN